MKLTRRERQVADLIVAGLTDRQMAEKLGVSAPTINSYTKTLYRKLDVHKRTQVAAALAAPPLEEAA